MSPCQPCVSCSRSSGSQGVSERGLRLPAVKDPIIGGLLLDNPTERRSAAPRSSEGEFLSHMPNSAQTLSTAGNYYLSHSYFRVAPLQKEIARKVLNSKTKSGNGK